MRRLLRTYRFWLPLLAVLTLEIDFRFGLWESQASFESHAGRTIMSKRVLQHTQTARIDYVTLGDSRARQGLDHGRLAQLARDHGRQHINLSLPGSHFLTAKVMSRYLRQQLPNLRAILLVVPEAVLQSRGNGAYELAIVQPLRAYSSTWEFSRHVPLKTGSLETWGSFSALMGYRQDVVDWLRFDPTRRAVGDVAPDDWWLTWTANETHDLCAFPVSEEDACERIAAMPGGGASGAELRAFCQRRLPGNADRRYALYEAELMEEWRAFLQDLSSEVNVVIVSLPQLSLFNERLILPRAATASDHLFQQLQQEGVIEWIDLRTALAQDLDECGAFQDPWHLNRAGQQHVTTALGERLTSLWYRQP